MTTPPNPRPVILSDRLYRLLLRAYPRRFRDEYGDEVAQLFLDCCRDAHRTHGTWGLLQVWGKGLGDLCLNVPREHLVQLVAGHGPAAAPRRSCSSCYSEIQADWRVCKVCGMYLNDATIHETRPIPSRRVPLITTGLQGVNRPLSFRDGRNSSESR